MPTRDVRVGAFNETALIEIPAHWRTLLENREIFFDFLMDKDHLSEEVTDSIYAMNLVFLLDQE